MAKFATFISDCELESQVIRAIHASQGELLVRGVSEEQLSALPKDVVLISNRKLNHCNKQVVVDNNDSFPQIMELLSTEFPSNQFRFDKGSHELIAFVGLSGGVGTTSIAINFAFELANRHAVTLIDLDQNFPEIALNLSMHQIIDRAERIGRNLQVIQGLPNNLGSDAVGAHQSGSLVIDVGANHDHPILEMADTIYLVTRLNGNTLSRLQKLQFAPNVFVCNFFERSKTQRNWVENLQSNYPRLSIKTVAFDAKSFELTAIRRCALSEVLPNSPARKHIATLI